MLRTGQSRESTCIFSLQVVKNGGLAMVMVMVMMMMMMMMMVMMMMTTLMGMRKRMRMMMSLLFFSSLSMSLSLLLDVVCCLLLFLLLLFLQMLRKLVLVRAGAMSPKSLFPSFQRHQIWFTPLAELVEAPSGSMFEEECGCEDSTVLPFRSV